MKETKVKEINMNCKGCVWLVNKNLCPFARCVNGFSWAKKNEKVER